MSPETRRLLGALIVSALHDVADALAAKLAAGRERIEA